MTRLLKRLAVLANAIGATASPVYGRGLPVTMMPFGIIGSAAFATLDLRSAGEQLADHGKLALRGMFTNR